MAEGFEVSKGYVAMYADDTGLRDSMAEKIKAAAAGLDVQVGLGLRNDAVERLDADVQAATDLAGEDKHVQVSLDVKPDAPEILGEDVRAAVDLAGEDAKVKVGLGLKDDAAAKLKAEVDAATKSTTNAGNAANNAGGGFGGLSGMMMLAAAAAVTLGPALAALPALLGGLGLGGIAAFGAMRDVVGALSAANQQATATGQTAAQVAQTAFSNAVAIRNAEQAITDAKRASAIAAQNSADSIVAANQQVAQSEQSEAQAAQQLAQAKIDAFNQIADLNNSAADANNSVADAQLGVDQAQQTLTATMVNSLSTDLQKKQAQQALIDAEQRLTDAKQHATEATQASTKANQEGVANFPPVVAAQNAYTQAVQSTANAQHALVVAQRNAADQAISSAESVQKAEQSLTDTIEQQRLAAAAAASTGASGANAYAQAMAKLTPVGQEVVKMLLGMNTGFTAASQNSFLPGVLAFLKDVQPLMPQFVGMVSLAGHAFGGFIAQIGELFKNKAFVADFFTVLQQGVGMLSTIGGGVIQLIHGVTAAAAGAGPIVTAVGQGIADVLAAIGSLFQGLTVDGSGAAQTIQSILDLVAGLLGPLGTLIGAISGALGPVLVALVPTFLKLVDVVVKALLPSLPQLSTALAAVANILALLLPAIFPLIGYLGDGLAPVLQVVSDIFQGLNVLISDNIGWIKPLIEVVLGIWGAVKLWTLAQSLLWTVMAANPIGLLIGALVALVGGVIYAYDHFQWFRDFIQHMFMDLHNWFFDFWHVANDVWRDVVGGAEAMARWFEALPDRLGRLGGQMWGWIGVGLKDAANGAIWVLNGMIHALNSLLHGLSDTWSWAGIPAIPSVPDIPYLAKGGRAIAPGVAVVGDDGPELMYMPKGASVVPLGAGGQGASASPGASVSVQEMHFHVDGLIDLTNPNAMSANTRTMMIKIRDALKLLDAAYA